jgi:ribonucleoside-diphosphate reductase alpha chain
MARFSDIDEFEEALYYGICMMLCGTMYSMLPLDKMYQVREKNRRLGLGLMGIHEWLLRRGYTYGPNKELSKWLKVYERAQQYAHEWSDKFGISKSVKTRAIAPTGTIAIVAETTSGIEPIYTIAMKRRYLRQDSSKTWCYQFLIDSSADRLIQDGVDPHDIEDAYDLAEDVERRIKMQAWVQQYVDHGISSTINMPKWGSSINNENTVKSFGETLLKYLPQLRGITVYPDEARGGQPLNRVSYAEAIKYIGKEYTESGEGVSVDFEEFGNERACVNGVCGI